MGDELEERVLFTPLSFSQERSLIIFFKAKRVIHPLSRCFRAQKQIIQTKEQLFSYFLCQLCFPKENNHRNHRILYELFLAVCYINAVNQFIS